MTSGLGDDRSILEAAHERCGGLIEQLRATERELEQRGPRVGDDVLAEGRAAYDRASAAGEALLRALHKPQTPRR